MEQRFDPRRTDFEPYGLSVTRWQSTPMDRTDRHNEIELSIVTKEGVTFQIGGRRIVVSPGNLIAFWAAIPHRVVDPICEQPYYVATVPLSTFLRFELPESMVQATLNGRVIAVNTDSVLMAAEPRLESWIADIESQDSLRLQAMTLDLQSLLLRIWSVAGLSLERSDKASLRALKGTEVSAVERIAAYLALHYTEPLTIDQISESVGLASGYAMTLFRKVFGQTMMQNLLDYRLAHAQRRLISTDDPILSIAFESGFGSLSRFNSVFKQQCGCAPRQYRKVHREVQSPIDSQI